MSDGMLGVLASLASSTRLDGDVLEQGRPWLSQFVYAVVRTLSTLLSL